MPDWIIPIPTKQIAVEFTVHGQPIPFARPRVVITKAGHRMTYSPKTSRVYRDDIKAMILEQRAYHPEPDRGYGVQVLFHRSNRQRVDVDNLLKGVLDAGTQAGVWKDDSQVREVLARVFLAQSEPRLECVIYYLDGLE